MRIALTTDTHFGFNGKTQSKHVKFLSKLKQESFDVLVHTGDIASHKQKQLHRSLAMFREAFPDKPILVVLGNHDIWLDNDWTTYASLKETQRQWFKEFNIHYLQDRPYTFKDEVVFYGFDGWYHYLPPPSTDHYHIPAMVETCSIDLYLNNRAAKSVDSILKSIDRIKQTKTYLRTVCATHHSLIIDKQEYERMCGNPKHMEFLGEKFDYVFYGHSHTKVDLIKEYQVEGKLHACRVCNAGSDYNNPKYIILDL